MHGADWLVVADMLCTDAASKMMQLIRFTAEPIDKKPYINYLTPNQSNNHGRARVG